MHLLDDLRWRGLVHQVTDEVVVRAAFDRGTTAYIGFDPTGASLHVGSLLQIVNLLRLAKAGQRAIAVVGGGTGMIGDPSGKSAERKLLTRDDVHANVGLLERQLRGFFERAGVAVDIVDNSDWLDGLGLIAFLRDIGKHFSVNAMVQRDSVRTRLEERDQGISYTEFSYMLLQAYDFLELYRRNGCAGQVGGSDQWGNIVSGLDLIDRLARSGNARAEPAWGLTVPLVTTKAGHKFGKTEAGAVWLDATLTSPYQLFQFWVNVDDDDVDRYLRYFTFLPHAEHTDLMAAHDAARHLRLAQKRLAREVLLLTHPSDLDAVQAATAILFGGDPVQASAQALAVVAREVPSVAVSATGDVPLHAVLVGEGRLFASNGEARRAIAANAVTISGQKWTADLQAAVPPELWLHGRFALARYGKKSWAMAVRQA